MSDTLYPKIVIAGPGRSGTTALIKALTELGLDTGIESLKYNSKASAGLERHRLPSGPSPQVVKWPGFTTRLPQLLRSGEVVPDQVGHVLVPIRDLDSAAASRVHLSHRRGLRRGGWGTMDGTSNPRKQRWVLAESVYVLLETLAEYDIPCTLLSYPRFITDVEYSHRRLKDLVPERSLDEFVITWDSVMDPGLVHTYSSDEFSWRATSELYLRDFRTRATRRLAERTKR